MFRLAASAITTYYGRFPVERARVLIVPVPDRSGIVQGTTWGDMAGWPGMTRFRIGQHATTEDLKDDWMMTHELDHMAFPSLPDDQHWMEEGLATYIEPIARVQTGELQPKQIWHDMVRDMHKGEPAEGDQGVDHTHTWGRTYWGGRNVLPGCGCGDSPADGQQKGSPGCIARDRGAGRDH